MSWTSGPRGLIRILLYPTIFERELTAAVAQRVAEGIRDGRLFGPSREDLEAAMRAALASEESLAEPAMAPQHSDASIRAYLTAVLERLDD